MLSPAKSRGCVIRIMMHNGIIKELSGVRYLPILRKNIILIGALEAEGLKVSIENVIFKMARGLSIVMKGVREGNFYYFRDNTESGIHGS